MSNNLKEEVSFKGKLTFEDYRKSSFYHSRNRFLKTLLILFISYTLVFWGIYTKRFDTTAILLALSCSIVTEIFLIITTYFRIKSVFYSESLLKLEQNYFANMDGISIKTEQTNALYLWNDIIASKEYKDMFILQVSKIKAMVIPKRYFSSEDDIKCFKSLIIEKSMSSKVKLL